MSAKHAGAAGKIAYADIAQLSTSTHALQPKIDGVYAALHTDATGCVYRVTNKRGRPLLVPEARQLTGLMVGEPDSTVVGELEAHTTAGKASASARGFAAVHIFDMTRFRGASIERQPYRERRHRMMTTLCQLEQLFGPDSDWTRDANRRAHDKRSGRFCRKNPRSWRRLIEVPQISVKHASKLWDLANAGACEGIVAVALDAPAGATRSKVKIKPVDTLDCWVRVVGDDILVVQHRDQRPFKVKRVPGADVGDLVAVSHEGFYASGIPRFARVESIRRDLVAGTA